MKARDWAAEEFAAVQKQVIVDRSAFFDRLALFHSGTIAATITFAGIVHQNPKWVVQWKICLFVSWVVIFLAAVAALARNWQAQNAWFHTMASVYEKNEGELSNAHGKLVTSGGTIVDRQTGSIMDPNKIRTGARDVSQLRTQRSQEHMKDSEDAERLRKLFETFTFILTAAGGALALVFAIRNFS